jgi:hypothetical protein
MLGGRGFGGAGEGYVALIYESTYYVDRIEKPLKPAYSFFNVLLTLFSCLWTFASVLGFYCSWMRVGDLDCEWKLLFPSFC